MSVINEAQYYGELVFKIYEQHHQNLIHFFPYLVEAEDEDLFSTPILEWLLDNITGRFLINDEELYFEDESDAVAFKLWYEMKLV